ncbi:VanZ family protein [Streptomyces sp. NPDC101490]|uniref:VanZ family protein n=1 Tax=Streptomyces sp. NPDC101490 TaxID=3366143 RepID=UPI00380C1E00
MAIVVTAGVWQARRGIHRRIPGDSFGQRAFFSILAIVSLAPFLLVTLLRGYGTGRSVSMVPFREFWTASSSVGVAFSEVTLVSFAGNALLFVPFGAAAAFLYSGPCRAIKATLTAALLSVAVETAQYQLSLGRVSSVDDVILNAAGAAWGALLVRRWSNAATGPSAPQPAEGRPLKELS